MPINVLLTRTDLPEELDDGFLKSGDNVKIIYGSQIWFKKVLTARPINITINGGTVLAGANTGWYILNEAGQFLDTSGRELTECVLFISNGTKFEYRMRKKQEFGSYKKPNASYLDYSMGEPASAYNIPPPGFGPGGAPPVRYWHLIPPPIRFNFYGPRSPEIRLTNLLAVPSIAGIMFCGYAYNVDDISHEQANTEGYSVREIGGFREG